MICSNCGEKGPEGGKFCAFCGHAMGNTATSDNATSDNAKSSSATSGSVPEASPAASPYAAYAAAPLQQTPAAEKAPKQQLGELLKNKKGIAIAGASLLLVALVAIIVPLAIKNGKTAKYEEALALMEQGDYAGAKVLLVELAAFEDAPAQVANCESAMAYEQAAELLLQERYAEAEAAFLQLGSFRDAAAQAAHCRNTAAYLQAEGLLEAADYAAAQAAFLQLGSFRDAAAQAAHCGNMTAYLQAEELLEAEEYAAAKALYAALPNVDFPEAKEKYDLCTSKVDYAAAEALYAQGAYYDAYIAFEALGEFDGASKRMSACVQPFPSTGELYHNPDYKSSALSLVIVPPKSDGSQNYIKIYTDNDVLVSCIAIGKGKKHKISLPAGSYRIKTAYGYGDWFGETDMFGDPGYYLVLKNGSGSNELFDLKKNYTYTLTLRSAQATSGDSVNSEKENRRSF